MRFNPILALFLGVVAASPMPQDTAEGAKEGKLPPGHEVTINQFSYGGAGCPQGSIGSTISTDGTLMNLKYDTFRVSVPEGERRTWCQLNVELNIPQGYQFSIMQTDYRGYCYLEKGLTSQHKATYYFSGDSGQTSRKVTFNGPQDGDYFVQDIIGIESVVWSPCGAKALLNLKQDISITPPGTKKYGEMDVASSDHKFEQIHYFQWRKCEEPKDGEH